MGLRVSGKNLDIGESLRQHVETRITGALAKYVTGTWSGHVTVMREGSGYRTECALHLASGPVLQATSVAGEPYASANEAVEHVEKRLRRYKRRLKNHHTDGGNSEPAIEAPSYILAAPSDDDDEAGYNPVVIAESSTRFKRMTVSAAVEELDLSGVSVVVFRHAVHGGVNVVYRRPDGHVGWVDPPPVDREDPR